MTLWRWLIAFLAWLSADPRAVDLEHPKASAAVSVARASMLRDAPPPPPPAPAPAPQACDCGKTCVRGVWKPDGRVQQTCKCACPRCVAERAKTTPAACTTGECFKGSARTP